MRKLAIVISCLIYVAVPTDLVPDFLVGPGQLDDLGAIIFAIHTLLAKRNDNHQLS